MTGTERKREMMVGVGLAGLVVGALVAVAVGSQEPDGSQATSEAGVQAVATAAKPAAPEAAAEAATSRLKPVVEAIRKAHARVHAEPGAAAGGTEADDPPAGGSAPLPAALSRAVQADAWFRSVRMAFHREVGAGSLVDETGPTPAGQALLDVLADLGAHDVDREPYGMPKLAEDVTAFAARVAGAGVKAPARLGDAGKVVLGLLRAPRFDAEKAKRKLEGASPALTPDDVKALADKLVAARQGDELRAAAWKLDAAMGKALLQLALDFRFYKRTGPFKLVTTEEKLLDKKRRRDRVGRQLRDIVEADDPEAALAALLPSHPMYAPMQQARAHYQAVVEADCHTKLPTSWRIRPGMSGTEIEKLQARLACEGYYEGPVDGTYGDALLEAVQSYQRHHEMKDDGLVFRDTIRSMNVPMERRLEQIELALARLRESPANRWQGTWMRVNVPAFELQAVVDGEITRRHKVIVGTNRLDDDKVALIQGHINRTRLFTTKLYEVIANPDWILPVRVEKGEVRSKLAENPDYLEEQGIVTRTLKSGRDILVQRGGTRANVLGKVKFLLEKSSAIYLHDTDKRNLFREQRRDFSHGCIRVHKPLDLAEWILLRDGYPKNEVERALGATSTQRGMKLKNPVDLVTEYMTVDIADDGKPMFLTDIYGYDRAYAAGKLPPKVQTRWGSAILRPNWVPLVPWRVVEEWRKSGTVAPHDYDPARHGGKQAAKDG